VILYARSPANEFLAIVYDQAESKQLLKTMYWPDGFEFNLEDAQNMELFSTEEIKCESGLPQDMGRLLPDDLESLTMEEFLRSNDLDGLGADLVMTEDNKDNLQAVVDFDHEDEIDEDAVYVAPVGLTDDQLVDMSAKEVNRLRGLTKQELKTIKKRRRVLLNRRYARKSREKRLDAQTSACTEKENLLVQMNEVKEELKSTQCERDMYKEKYLELREIVTSSLRKVKTEPR